MIKIVSKLLNIMEHWTVIEKLFNKKESKDYGQAGAQIFLVIAL